MALLASIARTKICRLGQRVTRRKRRQFLVGRSCGHQLGLTCEGDEKHVSMLSESVRDAILFTASKSHRAIDEDPHVDTIREFPDRYEIPEAFKEIESDGFDKHLLS